MADRFDFEQQILSCWGVVDNLKMLANRHNGSVEELEELVQAVALVYDAKFQECFATFEDLLVRKGEFK